jgi:hypothetical protein
MRVELIRVNAGTKTASRGTKRLPHRQAVGLASANVKEKICRFMSIVVRSAVN